MPLHPPSLEEGNETSFILHQISIIFFSTVSSSTLNSLSPSKTSSASSSFFPTNPNRLDPSPSSLLDHPSKIPFTVGPLEPPPPSRANSASFTKLQPTASPWSSTHKPPRPSPPPAGLPQLHLPLPSSTPGGAPSLSSRQPAPLAHLPDAGVLLHNPRRPLPHRSWPSPLLAAPPLHRRRPSPISTSTTRDGLCPTAPGQALSWRRLPLTASSPP